MPDVLVSLAAAFFGAFLQNCNIFELLLLVLLLAVAWRAKAPLPIPQLPPWFIDQRYWTFLSVFLVITVLGSLRLFLSGFPSPSVPDEWSHLFLADTLLAGRLANPSHPHFQFFETIHILPLPTRSSMYLFGPALWLAAGKFLFGHAFWGVLMAGAAVAAGLQWALEALVERRWAYLAALMLSVKIGFSGLWGGYWLDSYWGGMPGAMAGILVAGAFWRISRNIHAARNGLILGLAAGLLMNTRPFEGLALCAGLGAAAMWGTSGSNVPWRPMLQAALPASLVLALFAPAMAMHFQAVTGSPTMLPYGQNQKVYGWPMTLPWMTVSKPEIRHETLRAYWDWEYREHQLITTPIGIATGAVRKLYLNWQNFMGPLLVLPFWFARRKLPREVWMPFAFAALAVAIEQTGYPHYLSPATALIAAMLALGCQELHRGHPEFVRLLPVAVLCSALIHTLAPVVTEPAVASGKLCCRYAMGERRAQAERQLASLPGTHLVFVPDSIHVGDSNFYDWVYNPPAIDAAKVVFARDLGAIENETLIRYYPDRKVWRGGPDTPLRPY